MEADYVQVHFIDCHWPRSTCRVPDFCLNEEGDDQKLDKVLKAFDDFFEPRKHTAFERYRFNMRGQETGESFEQYIIMLRQLAQRCAFGTTTEDEILRDKVLFGIKNQQVREWLLREANLTLARTINICRVAESTAAQIKDINKMADGTVHVIKMSSHMSSKVKTVATSAATSFGFQILWKGARATQGTLSGLGQDLFQVSQAKSLCHQVPTSCSSRQN